MRLLPIAALALGILAACGPPTPGTGAQPQTSPGTGREPTQQRLHSQFVDM